LKDALLISRQAWDNWLPPAKERPLDDHISDALQLRLDDVHRYAGF
jgi:hypothetical protein